MSEQNIEKIPGGAQLVDDFGWVKRIAWGYLFIYLDLTVIVNLLPDFVGFALIYTSLKHLSRYRPTASLLELPCVLLVVLQLIEVFMSVILMEISAGFVGYLTTVFTALLTMYIHFQLLSDLAQFAVEYGAEHLEGKILNLRNVIVVLTTALNLSFFLPIDDGIAQIVFVGFLLVTVVLAFVVVFTMFSLARCVREANVE